MVVRVSCSLLLDVLGWVRCRLLVRFLMKMWCFWVMSVMWLCRMLSLRLIKGILFMIILFVCVLWILVSS